MGKCMNTEIVGTVPPQSDSTTAKSELSEYTIYNFYCKVKLYVQ